MRYRVCTSYSRSQIPLTLKVLTHRGSLDSLSLQTATTCRIYGQKRLCPTFPSAFHIVSVTLPEYYTCITDRYYNTVPNYFTISGPYGPHGLGSFLPCLEVIVENFIKVIKKLQRENIKSLTPKSYLAEALTEHADLFLARTAWSSNCASWFKQGRVDGQLCMFPASRLIFMEVMKEPRFEDYEIVYRSMNPWAFFGNGFSVRQSSGQDLSYYLGLLPQEMWSRAMKKSYRNFWPLGMLSTQLQIDTKRA